MRNQQSPAPGSSPGHVGTGRSHTQRSLLYFVAAGLFTAAMSSSANAMPITEPTSLGVGDTYRLAFVTSTTTDATSTDIATYNAFVDALGDTVIASDWTAIASTAPVDARINTSTFPGTDPVSGAPIFNLNDTMIAATYATLWDSGIDAALDTDELGGTGIVGNVWTGTDGLGRELDFIGARGLGAASPGYGDSSATGIDWVFTSTIGSNADSRRLYGISGLLTIPGPPAAIPEPGTFVVLAIGAAVVFGRRRRLRRRSQAGQTA